MKTTKKINQVLQTEKIDHQTGEVVESQTDVSFTVDREPDYIKLYLKDVLYLKDIPQSLSSFLMALVKRVTYASEDWGNCVVLNSSIREAVRKECNYKSMQSVYNNTRKLIKGEILEEVAKDIYRLNPYLFGRGDWREIEKIRAEVSYNKIEGRSFKMNFDHKEAEEHEKLEFAKKLQNEAMAREEQFHNEQNEQLENQQSMFETVDKQ